MNLFMGYIK